MERRVGRMDTNDVLSRYCERIGLDPDELRARYATEPVAATGQLIEHHCATIPFENFDGLTRGRVELGQPAVEKLLGSRGGYCHEHVDLLKQVLGELGVEVMRVGARIYHGKELSVAPPRTHQSLVATLNGQHYLVEAAFGGTNPLQPMLLGDAAPRRDRENTYRIVPAAESGYPDSALSDVDYMLEGEVNGHFESLYGFSAHPYPAADVELANHYTSTSPEHIFVRTPVAALHPASGKVTLSGTHLRTPEGERTLSTAEELRECAADVFGIVIDAATAQRAFDKAVQAQR